MHRFFSGYGYCTYIQTREHINLNIIDVTVIPDETGSYATFSCVIPVNTLSFCLQQIFLFSVNDMSFLIFKEQQSQVSVPVERAAL